MFKKLLKIKFPLDQLILKRLIKLVVHIVSMTLKKKKMVYYWVTSSEMVKRHPSQE